MVRIGNEDEELKNLEEELKKLESTEYGSPSQEKKENIFKFFREILRLKDTTRIGNLSNTELGVTRLGVRSYQEVSLYAAAEGLDTVSTYLSDKANIITATSMGRKGFWSKLFVTQIKREKKEEPTEKKNKWFSKTKPEEEAGE